MSSSHLLLLDADMVFVVGAGGRSALSAFVSAAEPDAVFLVLQCHGGLEYYNARIVPLRRVRAGDIRYVGVTHEYLHDASGRGAVRVPRDIAFIQDVSDGGCKHDKTERDIRLLTRALNDDDLSTGDRARYTFYLAQSYRDSGSGGKARAQEYYRARAAMPHTWVEEVAYSLLQLVRMALEDKDEAGALELLAKLAATGVRRSVLRDDGLLPGDRSPRGRDAVLDAHVPEHAGDARVRRRLAAVVFRHERRLRGSVRSEHCVVVHERSVVAAERARAVRGAARARKPGSARSHARRAAGQL